MFSLWIKGASSFRFYNDEKPRIGRLQHAILTEADPKASLYSRELLIQKIKRQNKYMLPTRSCKSKKKKKPL